MSEEYRIEEYKSLRDSIHLHMKLIPQILALTVTATGMLIGYGISSTSKNALVFLTPILIIIPCSYFIYSQMDELIRKGAYLMAQFEQGSGWGWETVLFEYRKQREQKSIISKIKKGILEMPEIALNALNAPGEAWAIVFIVDGLVCICIGFFFWMRSLGWHYPDVGNWIYIIIVLLLLIILWLDMGILKAYTSKNEEKYLDEFNKIEKAKKERI